MTAKQALNLTVIDPELILLAKYKSSEKTIPEINQSIQDFCRQGKNQPPRPEPEYEKFWFPTPETCNHPDQLQPLQKEIYDQITRLQHAEKLDPSKSEEDRYQFLETFPWQNTSLTEDECKQVENLLVEYHDIFAKLRFDVGYNTELKIKLTPEHDLPIYTQRPPTPNHFREELHIELALMHYYGPINTLPYSKYSSPLFAHRKESGKLSFLIDLRRFNHLLKDGYLNANFPISNMQDATNHFAGKTMFTKLDCSQAYHCVPMADELSVQLLLSTLRQGPMPTNAWHGVSANQ